LLVDLVQTTTADGIRLDGIFQAPAQARAAGRAVDAWCLVHGTGGNFYSSTLLEACAERLLELGCSVLRVNTRGHDGISTAAVTGRGGVRLGAAYEVVDDCRRDLAAWALWLRQRAGTRIGLLGHSLGAVKCLYASAQQPDLATRVVALSPPRLSYSWFCSSPESKQFLENYQEAQRLVQDGQPHALLEVRLPLPFVIAAAGYVEKYGPEERYNYLRFLSAVRCPVLVTLGSVEAQNNMAFRGAAEALGEVRHGQLAVEIIAGADHFYTGTRPELLARMEAWLRGAL
jgi:alpha-beta hydrolase superfamily lysophospholipase